MKKTVTIVSMFILSLNLFGSSLSDALDEINVKYEKVQDDTIVVRFSVDINQRPRNVVFLATIFDAEKKIKLQAVLADESGKDESLVFIGQECKGKKLYALIIAFANTVASFGDAKDTEIASKGNTFETNPKAALDKGEFVDFETLIPTEYRNENLKIKELLKRKNFFSGTAISFVASVGNVEDGLLRMNAFYNLKDENTAGVYCNVEPKSFDILNYRKGDIFVVKGVPTTDMFSSCAFQVQNASLRKITKKDALDVTPPPVQNGENNRKQCSENLKQISGAVDLCRTSENIAAPKAVNIFGPQGYIKKEPVCPTVNLPYEIKNTEIPDWKPTCPGKIEGHIVGQ